MNADLIVRNGRFNYAAPVEPDCYRCRDRRRGLHRGRPQVPLGCPRLYLLGGMTVNLTAPAGQ
jgi:hypothetical protein